METKKNGPIDLTDCMSSGKDVFFRSVRFVKDIMTEEVKTLTFDDGIEKCVELMKENQIRHVPIVDRSDQPHKLIGVISDRDLLRRIPLCIEQVDKNNSDIAVMAQPLSQIATINPITVTPDTPAADAIAIMIENNINMLPVLSDQEMAGIITSTDILLAFIRLDTILRLHPGEKKEAQRKNVIDSLCKESEGFSFQVPSVLQTVEDVMTEQVVSLDENETIAKAVDIMRSGNFMHLPIIDKSRELAGIISDRDILRHLQSSQTQFHTNAGSSRANLLDIAPDDPILDHPVGHIMETEVISIPLGFDFYAAVKIFCGKRTKKRISCLPVIDDANKIIGIFTVTDVMRGLLNVYKLSQPQNLDNNPLNN